MRFAVLDTNMPADWFDFLGERVPIDQSDVLIVTDDYLDNYPKDHPCKVALLIEPPLRKPHAYNAVYKNYEDFKYVFSFCKDVCQTLPNAQLCYFGGSAIPTDLWGRHEKTKLLSMVVSHKRDLPGNKLRYQVIDAFSSKIELFGFMRPIPNNFLGLKDYMFNICIENSRQDWYYTEKICDCFALYTVPIYWGTDTIGDLFNPKGILQFSDMDELHEILLMIDENVYNNMLPYIHENHMKAQELGLYDKNIKKAMSGVML